MFSGLKFYAYKAAQIGAYAFGITRERCYNLCNTWLDELPDQTKDTVEKDSKDSPVAKDICPPEILHDIIDHTSVNFTPKGIESRPSAKPTIMRGYLCASFEEGTSLGMAAMVVAIDEMHARQLLNQELKKSGLRLEDGDELLEIDLHTPGVTLESNITPNQFPDYSGW